MIQIKLTRMLQKMTNEEGPMSIPIHQFGLPTYLILMLNAISVITRRFFNSSNGSEFLYIVSRQLCVTRE